MEEILKSLPAPMQLNETVFVIAAIFLLLIYVLNRSVFKPLVAILEERRQRIDEGAQAQKQSLKTVEESMAAYRAAVVDARKKAQAQRLQMLKESEMIREEILTASKEKSMAMIQAAATELNKQVDRAKSGLKQESEALAREIVSTVLSRVSA